MFRHHADHGTDPPRHAAIPAKNSMPGAPLTAPLGRKRPSGRTAFLSTLRGFFLLVAASVVWNIAGCVAVPEDAVGAAEIEEVSVAEKDYTGSGNCAECHEEIHAKWEKTLHARMMQNPEENPDAILGDLTQKLPFKAEDIKYTLGNHWTQRYLTEIDGEYYVLPKMWSIQDREWRPYSIFSWKRKPWRVFCAGCHTTGYDYEAGTFVETSIGCEACHGPGSVHAENPSQQGSIVNPSKLSKERSLMVCESCHVKGRDNGNPDYCFPLQYLPGDDLAQTYTPLDMDETLDVAQTFHDRYEEWVDNTSQPEGSSCELCQDFRDPDDSKEEENDKTSKSTLICHSCHSMAAKADNHSHHPPEVECTDCHVPNFSKSGESQDIHSHQFQFRTPSKYLAYEECYEVKMEETCVTCHSGTTVNWAIKEISKWEKRPFKKLHKVGD